MNKRHTEILELLAKQKKAEVKDLSDLLGVSQVTIRKDLIALEKQGLIERSHGYASLNESDDLNNRLAYHYDLKQQIARIAIEDVEDGETIMIESGSCCALVALEIAQTRKDITLITNSAFIADFVRKENIKIILLGGEYQNESQVSVGPITRKCVEAFFVDKLYIGADGFTQTTGFTNTDYMRAETVKDMAKQAAHVIVVTESEKFEKKGVVNLIGMDQVSLVVTDANIPVDTEKFLKSKAIEVKKVES